MSDARSILADARSILLVDWPTRDVPNALVLAGFDVNAHGGPGPQDWFAYVADNGEVVERKVGLPPEHADLVYTFRPLDELPEIVDLAGTVGAGTIWVHSGVSAAGEKDHTGCWLSDEDAASAQAAVEAAGLVYVDQPYIADVARALGRS